MYGLSLEIVPHYLIGGELNNLSYEVSGEHHFYRIVRIRAPNQVMGESRGTQRHAQHINISNESDADICG